MWTPLRFVIAYAVLTVLSAWLAVAGLVDPDVVWWLPLTFGVFAVVSGANLAVWVSKYRRSRPSRAAAAGSGAADSEVLDVVEAFEPHDLAALARLTPQERIEQLQVRQVLHAYLTAIWEAPKHRAGYDEGRHHPGNDPSFACVASMLDLAGCLVAHVEIAQQAAGDDSDYSPNPLPLLEPDRFAPDGD